MKDQLPNVVREELEDLMAILELELENPKPEETRAVLVHVQETLGLDGREEVAYKLHAKDQVARWEWYTDLLQDAISKNPPLVTGQTPEQKLEQFLQLVGEAESPWDDCVLLFLNKRYARATSLAISCMEEAGKIGVAQFQILLPVAAKDRARTNKARRKGNPLFSHPHKHLLACGSGALVNSRVDRVLGMDQVIRFLESAESGDIVRLREATLYTDLTADGLNIPSVVVSVDQARFYVVLAGELVAEVFGLAPQDEWERLRGKVSSFEEEVGLGQRSQ